TYEITGRTYVPGNPAWDIVSASMSEIPVLAAALGPVAGLGAARGPCSPFSVMVRGLAHVFVGGPPGVERAVGTPIDKESLGGSQIQAAAGSVDNVVDSEDEALDQIRRVLGYLPRNMWEMPARATPTHDPRRRAPELLSIIPRNRRRPYDVRKLLAHVVDQGSFLEIGAKYGPSLVAGLARLDGYPIGVLANDPMHAGGALTAAG